MTDFISGGRGVGKTRMLIEKMLENDEAVYLGATLRRARLAWEAAIELYEEREGVRLGKHSRNRLAERFISVHDWIDKHRQGRYSAPIYVDDVEEVLIAILGNVQTVTLTEPVQTIRIMNTDPEN